jgi:hypothetical protein
LAFVPNSQSPPPHGRGSDKCTTRPRCYPEWNRQGIATESHAGRAITRLGRRCRPPESFLTERPSRWPRTQAPCHWSPTAMAGSISQPSSDGVKSRGRQRQRGRRRGPRWPRSPPVLRRRGATHLGQTSPITRTFEQGHPVDDLSGRPPATFTRSPATSRAALSALSPRSGRKQIGRSEQPVRRGQHPAAPRAIRLEPEPLPPSEERRASGPTGPRSAAGTDCPARPAAATRATPGPRFVGQGEAVAVAHRLAGVRAAWPGPPRRPAASPTTPSRPPPRSARCPP